MTREEAIEVLKDIYNYTRFDTYTTNEARSMAIEALEQEPCDDAVSIQVVNEILLKYAHSEEGKLFTEFLISQIKDLPPVLPKREQGEWIEHPHECGENWEFSKYECSICHVWEENDSDFCPNCGAEMR